MTTKFAAGTKFKVPGVKGVMTLPSEVEESKLDKTFICLDRYGENQCRAFLFTESNDKLTAAEILEKNQMRLGSNGVWQNKGFGGIDFNYKNIFNEDNNTIFYTYINFVETQKRIYTMRELIAPEIKVITSYEYKDVKYDTYEEAENAMMFEQIRSSGLFGKAQLQYIRDNIELFKKLNFKKKD